MLPGPNYVYKCPNCGNLLTNGSLISGNTFGADIFSDGKRIAPMLQEFPNLTKCTKCEAIFWLSKLKEIGTYEWGDKENLNWKNMDRAVFLNIEDYFRVLEEGIVENEKEELFVRQRIWWAYNDRVRIGKDPFIDVNEEIKYRENCNKLILLLDQSELNQRIMTAELKRNLGDFDGCIEIITKIDTDELNWLKNLFIGECEKGNKLVVKLK